MPMNFIFPLSCIHVNLSNELSKRGQSHVDLLRANPNTYAVVVSTENITLNWYFGNDPLCCSNCIFCMKFSYNSRIARSVSRTQVEYKKMIVLGMLMYVPMLCHKSSTNCVTSVT